MPDSYVNPFAVQPNPSDLQMGSPLTGNISLMPAFQAGVNQSTAAPFIQQAQQGGAADLQKKLMEAKEFTSPEAQKARMSGFQLQAAQNDANLGLVPFKTAADREKYIADQKKALPQADQAIAEANQAALKAKGTPYAELTDSLASLYPQLDQAKGNPAAQRMILEAGLGAWERSHPGMKVPDEFRAPNDTTLQHIKALHLAALNNPAHLQALQLEKMKEESAQKVASTQAGAEIGAARIHAASAEQVAGMGNPERQVAAARTAYRTKPTEDNLAALRTAEETRFAQSIYPNRAKVHAQEEANRVLYERMNGRDATYTPLDYNNELQNHLEQSVPGYKRPGKAAANVPTVGTKRTINGTPAHWDGKGWVAD